VEHLVGIIEDIAFGFIRAVELCPGTTCQLLSALLSRTSEKM